MTNNIKLEGVDYVHGTFVILTNEVDYDDYPYEEYVMECEDNGLKPGSPDSQKYYDWVDMYVQSYWEDDLKNIKNCKEYNVPVTITGELGLWDGQHTIAPVKMDSVYDAVMKCIGRDSSYVTVYFVDGSISVHAHHHDGCNCFTISAKKRLPYLYNI
jgi:hypothetical protein